MHDSHVKLWLKRRYKRQYLYDTWYSMKRRCEDPRHPYYHNYGGRGITVCPEWQDQVVFAQDMGPRPMGHTLDRIDVDGNYTPQNCRWADDVTQRYNTRKRKSS